MAENNVKPGEAVADAAASFDKSEINSIKIQLETPFVFDQVEVKEIDMTAIADLTAGQLVEIDREMINLGYRGVESESTRQYAMLVAAKINHKPMEWLMRMSARDSIRLREFVRRFFYARA